MPARDRQHYTGSYDLRAKRVRDAAYSDPLTRCWRCGKTLAEVQRTDPDVRWHAGHTVDGSSAHPLAPEHSTCNTSAGGKLGSKKRWLNPSRRWY
jgi:hypothetical protein